MIKNKRLNFIASLIDKNTNILLDIGTDHGYLIKKAFDNGKIRKAIATDINELPLNNAKNNLTNYNVEFILTDGFKGVKSEFDLVVIAGMGGNLNSIVASYNLHPTQLRIGDKIARPPDQGNEEYRLPEIARIKDGEVIIEPYLPNK